MIKKAVLLGALAALFSLNAAAQHALTVYGGYRGGGAFEQTTAPFASVDLKGSAALSLALDWAVDRRRQVQVFMSYQSTDLEATGNSPATPMTVGYLHLGGTNYFEGDIGKGAYVVGGLGATRLAPNLAGLSAEVRPSMNLGLGYQLPLASNVSLRAEVRGYLTLINSSSNLFCSGGCVLSVKGDLFTQAEAMLGLSVGF
jgi:hypothetical protein